MKKYRYQWLLALFFIFFIINLGLDVCYFWNYQDKMNLLEQMLQVDSESRIDAAARILKSDAVEFEGQQLLAQYGYTGNVQNRFYLEFLKACVLTAAGSVTLLLLLWFLDYLYRKREVAV